MKTKHDIFGHFAEAIMTLLYLNWKGKKTSLTGYKGVVFMPKYFYKGSEIDLQYAS